MKTKADAKLFPALIASMGDWTYYISFMEMGEIAERVSIVQDIHHEKALRELLQRGLTRNADKISTYLQMQQQRFFNAIVIGTYGGSPKWHEVAIKEAHEVAIKEAKDSSGLTGDLQGALGFLELSGEEILFAIDGQHRVAGMKRAVTEDPSLASEEVAALFVRGVAARKRAEDPDGYQRTRRLFTTLNRNAKPVQKKDIIALDEDDLIAIITRRFLEEHPLFVGKISVSKTKSIPRTDQKHFTSIVTLYDVLDMVLRDRFRGWNVFKKLRPPDDELDRYQERGRRFWSLMSEHFPPLHAIQDQEPRDDLVSQYRNLDGGHVLFRPIGLLVVVKAIMELVKTGTDLGAAISVASKAPLELASEPWKNLLWDRINNRMITDSKNKTVAKNLFFHMIGGKYSAKERRQLTKDLAGLKNLEVEQVDLQSWLIQ